MIITVITKRHLFSSLSVGKLYNYLHDIGVHVILGQDHPASQADELAWHNKTPGKMNSQEVSIVPIVTNRRITDEQAI